MKRIDRYTEIEPLLNSGRKGTAILNLFIASDMDQAMNKMGNPYHGKGMVKEVSLCIVTGFRYREAVLNRTRKEMKAKGMTEDQIKDFCSSIPFGERKWGEKREDRKFVDHKGEKYIACYVLSSTEPLYRIGRQVIDVEAIKPYLKKKGEEGGKVQAHLKKKVVYRDVKFPSILCIRYRGEDYLVDDLEPLTPPEAVKQAPKNPELESLLEQEFGPNRLEEAGHIETD